MAKPSDSATVLSPISSLEMVLVKHGSFIMGNEKEKIQMTIEKDFWIGKFQVTQKQWFEITGNNPSRFQGEDRPVERVSWDDVQKFLSILNGTDIKRKTIEGMQERGEITDLSANEIEGLKFRLPSEAEWEFAARGGNSSKGYKYAGSRDIDEVAWYVDNSHGESKAVGLKSPNELGIYDMSGNVWEWCADFYTDLKNMDKNGQPFTKEGTLRVIRGGGWNIDSASCLPSYRYLDFWYDGLSDVGFRLVLAFLG